MMPTIIKRGFVSLTLVTLAMPQTGLAAVTVSAGDTAARQISVIGRELYVPNQIVQDTMHFSPGWLRVKQGSWLDLIDKANSDEPHTFTLAAAGDIPQSFDEAVEGNGFTQGILAAHQNGAVKFLNKGGAGF